MRRLLLSVGPAAVAFSLVGLLGCSSDSSGGGGGGSGALDGTWDITTNTRGGPAEVVVSGGVVTGYMASRYEGQPKYEGQDNCIAAKLRTEFTVNTSGNTVAATVTHVRQGSGSGCADVQEHKEIRVFSGVRSSGGPNWDGIWSFTGEGESWTATVNGLSVTAESQIVTKRPKVDRMNIAVAGDMLTMSSTDESLAFGAHRKR